MKKHIICMKINNIDIIGRTDKDPSFDIFAYASIEIENPVALIQTQQGGMAIVPYFMFTKDSVTTINCTRVESFLTESHLPKEITNKYIEFTSGITLVRG